MFIAYNVPPASTNPALVEDVFSDREPYGEYLYYVSCDDAAVVQTGEKQSVLASLSSAENACIGGARIHESDCIVIHTVSVSFHEDNLEYCQSVIDEEQSEEYDNFNAIRGPLDLDTKSIKEFMDLTPQFPKIQLQMGSGEDWAALVVFTKEEIKAKFHYLKVSDNRTIEVITRSSSLDTTIGDLLDPWNKLVEKYKDMPMNVFSGANIW